MNKPVQVVRKWVDRQTSTTSSPLTIQGHIERWPEL